MAAQILATKLYLPPPRPQTVLRPRLLGQLDAVLRHKLTLISAPAGFGKSTLVGEWAAVCRECPVAWLSLDEGDHDPARFLTYLIAALQTLAPEMGKEALSLIQSPQPPEVESILTTLLNEIATVPGQGFVLVLDDYHAVDSKLVDDALAFLLVHLPEQMHLVIATREDPHLPLSRLRARGQLTELRAADLRFTPAEAAEFLNQVMGLHLSADDIAALENRTEGWIAGLQLAALSMQGHQDVTGFIRSFTGSHHFIMDYLMEEVLGGQSESVQAFLLRTSILDRLCGPLCDAVLLDDPASGQETLEYLERANLFLVPLDNERRWYRYHHLFGELLRQRLGHPQELQDYHLRASAWYQANDDLAKAFHHACAAGDFERAAHLAEEAWQGMERTFQTATWLGWVKKLPDAVVCSRPRLCLQLASAFSDAGELETSETHLQNAERALAGVADSYESKSLAGNIALIRASNAQNQGDLAKSVKYAELSLLLAPEDDFYLRAQAVITLELTHWTTGDLEASIQAMRAWKEDMQRLGNQVFVIASAFAVADMQVAMGRLGEAENGLRQAIQQAAELGQEAELVTAHHHLGLALLAHEQGDDKAAAGHWKTAAELGQHTTLVDWHYRWNLAQVRLRESAGEWDASLNLLDEARRGYVKTAIPNLQPIEAHKARVYLKQGRLDKAQSWVREGGMSTEAEVRYLDEYDLLTLARVRMSEGVFTGVDDLVERLLALAEAQKRTGSVLEILLTQALLHQAQGNASQALAALERALALAQPEGYLRLFVDEGEAMRLLILDFRGMVEKQASPGMYPLSGYVDKLLGAFPESTVATSQSKALAPGASAGVVNRKSEIDNRNSIIDNRNHLHLVPVQVSIIVDPLTDRELEVLHLIAEGYSNAEISKRLYLALSTVKGHNLRIFHKLQAQNRTEAVARARELGLI